MGWFNGIEFGLILGAFVALFLVFKLSINCALDDIEEEKNRTEQLKKDNFKKLLSQADGLWK